MSVSEFQAATYSAKPSVRVSNSTALTLTTSVTLVLTFNTERYDRLGMHSTSSNTNRLTAAVPGIYSIGGNVTVAAGVGTTRIFFIEAVFS